MTDNQKDPRDNFAPRWLPWVSGGIMLVVYLLTLNHWVSLLSLPTVARICGWVWQPDLYNPVLFLFSLPFHLLPAVLVPVVLNGVTAFCAAVSLALLARTVALLPQDRTEAQRKREGSVFAFLTTRSAWLPPSLAVAVCGLQYAFWQHATNFSGEMVQLLMFATVVWLLAEFRIDEREGRLHLAALVFGAGMADNWAMVAYFPLFIVALIWLRGFEFFSVRFLARMVLLGLAGMSLYLLMPAITAFFGRLPVTFGEALKYEFLAQWRVLKMISVSDVRHTLALMSLTTLVPVLVMGIRWSRTFGDSSELGRTLTSWMFHLVHMVILFVCVWVSFDPPFSTQHLAAWPWPQLTLHYVGSIAVGYFSGYLLLVLGRPLASSRSRRSGSRAKTTGWHYLVVGGLGLCAALTTLGLLYKNVPLIRGINDNLYQKYADLIEAGLPATGGYLLADSNSGPWPGYLMQAALVRDGLDRKFLVLDTQGLEWAPYHQFLHRAHPGRWPQPANPKYQGKIDPHELAQRLVELSRSNSICYLHPSYGYYFESFYMEPHGMIYQLKLRPQDQPLTPAPDAALIAENEQFWVRAQDTTFNRIEKEMAVPDPNTPLSLGGRLMQRLHIEQEPNLGLQIIGGYYSEALNYWGVQLQRAGRLVPAAAHFETALKLNPDNVVAQINLDFNHALAAGKSAPIDLSTTTSDRFGKYNTWNEVLNANGPFDEPSFCFESGSIMSQNTYFRQALEYFVRARELAPDNLATRLWLGQLYVFNRLPDRAMEAIQDPLDHPEKYGLTPYNSTELNIIAAGAYFQKGNLDAGSRLVEKEIAQHPDDDQLLTFTTQAYIMHGLYTNALGVINRKLERTPNDITWLSGKGYVTMQLKAYDKAVTTYNLMLAMQTNNSEAFFNRAVANLQLGKLDSARNDYLHLQQTYTNAFPIAYGLGEIAWRQHDTNEAIRNYEIYLANAPTNTAEAGNVRDRLASLKGR